MLGQHTDKLDGTQDVVRYAGGSQLDPNTGEVAGSVFDRHAKDVDGLSFTQVGILALEREDDDFEIRRVVGARRKLGKLGCFVEINVGAALDALNEFDQDFWFKPDPLPAEGVFPANPAHTLLIGLPFQGELLGSLKSELAGDLLRRQIKRVFPAVI